jgi:hypothetical protein
VVVAVSVFDEDGGGSAGGAAEVEAEPRRPISGEGRSRGAGEKRPSRQVPTLRRQPRRPPYHAILRVDPGAKIPLRSGPTGKLVRMIGPQSEFGSALVLGVAQRRGPWFGVTTPLRGNGELGWVRREPRDLELYWTRYSLTVRRAARALELRYGRRLIDRYPVTVGGAGTETPRGRFSITDALAFDSSPDYGCCALALTGHQENLPPGWLGGDRIAIHGTPGPVGNAESLGCIRATDDTMRTLFDRVPLGTPVFVKG